MISKDGLSESRNVNIKITLEVQFPWFSEGVIVFQYMLAESEVIQSCPTLCAPVDYSLLDCSVHGILQARVLEWIAISFSRGSSRPRDRTRVSHIGGRRFNL